jgi:hypothetical protein
MAEKTTPAPPPEKSELKDINLVYLDIPQEFLLEVTINFWPTATPEDSQLVFTTLATHESYHCLQSGLDFACKPCVPGIRFNDLFLWDESFCSCRPDKVSGLACDGACVNWGL